MSFSKVMKSSSLLVVNQHGNCHLSIIIKQAGRGRPCGRSEHSDSWPYNKDSFVCIDSAVEECYNLSHTELHCLRVRERTRERTDREGQRQTERRTDRDMNGRMYITGTQEQLSFKLWNNTIPYRQRVGGGLIDRRHVAAAIWPLTYIHSRSLQLFSLMWIMLRRPIKRRLISLSQSSESLAI